MYVFAQRIGVIFDTLRMRKLNCQAAPPAVGAASTLKLF